MQALARLPSLVEAALDPPVAASVAGLRYVSDATAGLRRVRSGKGFRYIDLRGKTVRDEATLARIRSLAIPPAWTDVWICPSPNGHLQATGRDARGRKQYRYHPRWREVRDETKYTKMVAFGRALPALRRQVEKDLELPGLPREKVLATIVRLLRKTLIRVGNEEYVRQNASYGLTTLRERHVDVRGSRLRFHFKGKSGVRHDVDVEDERVAAVVRRCQDLPGEELFQYVDDDGSLRSVSSGDVNDYLHAICGEAFTAKDFRTWAGTVLAARELRAAGVCGSKTQAKKLVATAVEAVAARLGNTRAVCRKCYVHPAVIDSFMAGELCKALQHPRRPRKGLSAEEEAVLQFLEAQLRPHPVKKR